MLVPQIEGTVSIRSPAESFLRAFRERVTAGLLEGRPHPRCNYVVSEAASGALVVLAGDWWTAINVGLNRVELRHLPPDLIRYDVRYWRWALYALSLSGGLGLVGLAMLLSLDVRGYIARNERSMIPGLSIEQNLVIRMADGALLGIRLALAPHCAAQTSTARIGDASDRRG